MSIGPWSANFFSFCIQVTGTSDEQYYFCEHPVKELRSRLRFVCDTVSCQISISRPWFRLQAESSYFAKFVHTFMEVFYRHQKMTKSVPYVAEKSLHTERFPKFLASSAPDHCAERGKWPNCRKQEFPRAKEQFFLPILISWILVLLKCRISMMRSITFFERPKKRHKVNWKCAQVEIIRLQLMHFEGSSSLCLWYCSHHTNLGFESS